MPRFSNVSWSRLGTCDKRLQTLFEAVVQHVDCTIIEGHRTMERQLALYRAGRSTVLRGRHNEYPSLAVDAAPYPIPDWEDTMRFEVFGLYVLETAVELAIPIRWGGNWRGDWTGEGPRPRQTFDDLVHFELHDP